MAKKITSGNKIPAAVSRQSEIVESPLPSWSGILVTIAFIFVLALEGSMDNIVGKWMGLASAVIMLFLLFASKRTSLLKESITPLFYSIIAYIMWGGISTFYAASGKFAIYEFSKLLVALGVYLAVLFFTSNDQSGFKKVSYLLAFAGAFFGIVSVDAASFGILTKIFKSFFGVFTEAYKATGAFEEGIRITSIFGNPNTYAGLMAISVLLSLYLAINASGKKEACIAKSLLAINALSYLLAFSMGSLFMFLIACLIMLGISKKGERVTLFLLMLETAIFSFLFVFISMLGLGKTGVAALTPILALALNAVCLCLVDERLRMKVTKKLNEDSKFLLGSTLIIIIGISVYLLAAFSISGNMTLSANETKMRAAYLPGGEYSLEVDSSQPISVRIESQNKYDLMRHTSTTLYNATNEQAISFAVPDDSEIIQINFIAGSENAEISKASYTGAESGNVHLNYPLLPNIIANRIQNMFANENLVQRVTFFEDGIKLFSKSPMIGRGLGGFENGVYSVQDFYYETKYTHNHYIQVLCDLGIVGLVLFVSVLASSVISIVTAKRKSSSLFAVPVLAACLFQIFGQASVDAVWSIGYFLAFAAAILALVTKFCSPPIKLKESFNKDCLKIIEKSVIAVFAGVFVLLLSGNLYAQAQAKAGVENFDDIKRLVSIDRFEYNDYKLSYIVNAPQMDSEEVQKQAEIYADELMSVESNSLTPYIMQYKYKTYFDNDAYEIAKRGIQNNQSNPNAWIQIFDTFEEFIDPVGPYTDDAAERLKSSKAYINNVLDLYNLLLERNKNSLDEITLTPYNNAFIGKLLEIQATHLYSLDWVFTAIMTYAFDSDCAVDANQDGLPDALTVLSGDIQREEDGLQFKVFDNTSIQLDLYHKLGGTYTLAFDMKTPVQDMVVTLNGTEQQVTYEDDKAYVVVELADNSDKALSTFVITFPTAAEIKNITFKTKLES